MKKILIFLLVIITAFSVACGPVPTDPTDPPDLGIPPFNPSGPSPSGSNPSGSTPPSDLPPTTPPAEQPPAQGGHNNVFQIKITLGEDGNGKYQNKVAEKTLINVKQDTSAYPSNKDKFAFITDFTPKDIYEKPFSYEYVDKSASEIESMQKLVLDFQLDTLIAKTQNFIRYIYVQTQGDILLSVSFDSSCVYQTNYVNDIVVGGYVIRAYVSIEKRGSTGPIMEEFNSVNALLNAELPAIDETGNNYTSTLMNYFNNGSRNANRYVVDESYKTKYPSLEKYNYQEVPNKAGHYYLVDKANNNYYHQRLTQHFFINPITQESGISVGNGFWADIFIGIPIGGDTASPSSTWTSLITQNGWGQY